MKTEQEQIEEIMETLLAHQPFIDVPYEKIYDIAIALVKEGYGKVSEYKAEIEDLKAEFKQLETNAEILARGVRDLNHENYELTEKIKQAQIDVLNKVKDIVFDYLGVKNIKEAEALSLLDSTLTYDVVTCGIDELIKEVENGEDKG